MELRKDDRYWTKPEKARVDGETSVSFSFRPCVSHPRQSAYEEERLCLVLEVSVHSELILLLWGLG